MKQILLLLAILSSFANPGYAQWAVDSLSAGRLDLQAVTFGDKVYFIGGETGEYPEHETAEVAVFDCLASAWDPSDAHSLSLGRSASACVSGDSGFYVVGGRIRDWNVVGIWGIPVYYATNRIDIFKNGTWHIDSLPDRVWGGRALKVGSKLLFTGFVDSVNYLISEIYASKKVYIFDESTGLWSTDSLSSARTELGAATDGTLAIFAGGVNGLGVTSGVVDIYNSATGSWSTASLSVARGYVGAAYAAGKFYFAGGVLAGALNASTDVIDVYDGLSWTTDHLSVPRGGVMALAVNDEVYFMGGSEFDLSFLPYPNSNGTYNTVDVLNTVSGSWSRQDFAFPYIFPWVPVTAWHQYAGFTAWGNKIYVAGGGVAGWLQNNAIRAYSPYVEILDVPLGLAGTGEPVSFDVFPNPSPGPVTVVLPIARATIRVFDAYGREVLTSEVRGRNTELHLERSGMYVVQVQTPHGTSTRKVVIRG